MASEEETEVPSEYLGPWTESADLPRSVLVQAVQRLCSQPMSKRDSSDDVERAPELCTNGLVLELAALQQTEGFSDDTFRMLLSAIFPQKGLFVSSKVLQRRVQRLKDSRKRAQKAGKRSSAPLDELLSSQFSLAGPAVSSSVSSSSLSSPPVSATTSSIASSSATVSATDTEAVSMEHDELLSEDSDLSSKIENMESSLAAYRDKLRNVRKMLKRRDAKVQQQDEEIEAAAMQAKSTHQSQLNVHHQREYQLRKKLEDADGKVVALECQLKDSKSRGVKPHQGECSTAV